MSLLAPEQIADLHKWLAHASPARRAAFAHYAQTLYAATGASVLLEVLDIVAEYAPVDPSPDYQEVDR